MRNVKNKKYNFIYRAFLNSGEYHSTACVVAKISDSEYGDNPNCEFNISDCGRTITLDLDAYTEADVENSFYKLNILIEAAQKMKKALEKLKPHVIQLELDRKKKEEEREAKKEAESKKEKNE